LIIAHTIETNFRMTSVRRAMCPATGPSTGLAMCPLHLVVAACHHICKGGARRDAKERGVARLLVS
jgi:hypothetical protein